MLISVCFKEHGYDVVQKVLNQADHVYSSGLAEAEIMAACARESVPYAQVEEALGKLIFTYPSRSLKHELETVFASGYLRGADAHHLATALFLDPTTKFLRFLTADKRQSELAAKLGFKTR